MFTIVGIVTFELSVQELKNLLGSRNEGFAYNIMQDLDKHIENRVIDFQELTNLSLIHSALIESNNQFKNIEDIDSYLNSKETQVFRSSPFLGNTIEEILTDELVQTIEFYRDQYDYDVVEELFVTNAYGANVVIGTGTSDYSHNDEEWWQITKNTGKYVGDIEFNEKYDSYSIIFSFRIDDVDGNFIGVLRVLITLNDLLSNFLDDVDVITISVPGRSVILLDKNGFPIYADKQIFLSDSQTSYFQNIAQGKDIGFFELEDKEDNFRLISYSKSTGYRTFEGFDWIVVVEQNSSSIVQEFVDLRNSILLISFLGMIASIVGGYLISSTVSTPLKHLIDVANSISKGNFDVNIKQNKIDEIKMIGDTFENMAENLKKLIETEKQLAEAHVKIRNERLTAIGELAASMAHNIKNSLATIKSSADILQKNIPYDEELKKVGTRMNRAIDGMSKQINDVLDYVRVTPLDLNTIKISELLQSAANSLEIPNNVSIFIPTSDIEIVGDIRKLEIGFTNIFLNSIQAIGRDGGKIECKIKQKESMVIIEIQDSGPGIPDAIFSKIFDSLITSKQKGTGLGLSTCKNVIELHHGTITAQNNPTTFIVTLPILQE